MTLELPEKFMIFNPSTNKTLFVSSDLKNGDHVVEAHSNIGDDRNWFKLVKDDNGLHQIYNIATRLSIVPSNDYDGADRYVEAKNPDGPRFGYTFIENKSEPDKWKIFNPTTQVFLFVSSTISAGDNIVEGHQDSEDARNYFQFLVTYQGN